MSLVSLSPYAIGGYKGVEQADFRLLATSTGRLCSIRGGATGFSCTFFTPLSIFNIIVTLVALTTASEIPPTHPLSQSRILFKDSSIRVWELYSKQSSCYPLPCTPLPFRATGPWKACPDQDGWRKERIRHGYKQSHWVRLIVRLSVFCSVHGERVLLHITEVAS